MGLLSTIGNILSEMSEIADETSAKAEKMPTKYICDRMRSATFSECSGYLSVLRERSYEMSNDELIELLERLQKERNAKAISGIMPEMSERGLADWRDGGGIIKHY